MQVAVLWIGTAERISAVVQMNHPGVWIIGDTADGDRRHGMGIVVEYAVRPGKAQWIAPPSFKWNYIRFASVGATPVSPDEIVDMTFAKDNAAEEGFNRWTIKGIAYPMANEMAPASFHLKQGQRYRLRMRNASDDIHPIHLHRHSFELTSLAGNATAGILKDVVMLGGYQEAEVDFVADNPGLTLFHCHQQLHMDFGFMAPIRLCVGDRRRRATFNAARYYYCSRVPRFLILTWKKKPLDFSRSGPPRMHS